jgi:hypothetical protein
MMLRQAAGLPIFHTLDTPRAEPRTTSCARRSECAERAKLANSST